MQAHFLDVRPTGDSSRWRLDVDRSHCVGPEGRHFLFGGVGLGAAISALSEMTDRVLVCITAQYLSYAQPPGTLHLDLRTLAEGKRNSQVAAEASMSGTPVFRASAALGARPDPLSRQWVTAPKTAAPEDCPLRPRWRASADDLHSRLEVRIVEEASQSSTDGRTLLWVRPRGSFAIDVPLLAIMADFVPSAVGPALGVNAGGNSLDITFRLCRWVPTDWVLCDITIYGMHAGIVHGATRMFSRDGVLMATASQSLIVRRR